MTAGLSASEVAVTGEEEGAASLPLPQASIQITVLQSAPYLMRLLNRTWGGGRRQRLRLWPGQLCQDHPSLPRGCNEIREDAGALPSYLAVPPSGYLVTLKQLPVLSGDWLELLPNQEVHVCVRDGWPQEGQNIPCHQAGDPRSLPHTPVERDRRIELLPPQA